MFRRLILPLLVLTFILTACGGEAQTQVEEDSVQEAAPAPQATHTEAPPMETPVLVAEEEPVTVKLVSECTIVSSSPLEADSQYVDLFGVTEADWVSGPDTAALTIVEYGDYQ
ncbi:MAG: hypothetical protein ISS57_15995 [Anaerolineales bacterium]|nr:hypothetical protein [Anaerolineales bacterium]